MPFQGFNFIRNQNFTRDRNAGPPDHFISAEKVDDELTNIADALTEARTAGALADEKAELARERAETAVVTVRGGVDEPRNTLKKLLDWVVARLGEKLNLTGGALSGNLTVEVPSNVAPAFNLVRRDVKAGRWIVAEQGAVYWQDVDSGQIHFRIFPDGRVWTQQFGDLNDRIETRTANRRDEAIAVANDRVIRNWITTAGLDSNNPDLPYMRRESDGGIIYLQRRLGYTPARQLGGNIIGFRWADGRIIGNVDNAVEKSFLTLQDDNLRIDEKFNNTRLTGGAGMSTGQDAPSGAVLTRAGNANITTGYKFLQNFSPSRGWVSAYNEG